MVEAAAAGSCPRAAEARAAAVEAADRYALAAAADQGLDRQARWAYRLGNAAAQATFETASANPTAAPASPGAAGKPSVIQYREVAVAAGCEYPEAAAPAARGEEEAVKQAVLVRRVFSA